MKRFSAYDFYISSYASYANELFTNPPEKNRVKSFSVKKNPPSDVKKILLLMFPPKSK